MSFLRKLFVRRERTLPLGLADPMHPAKKWIDLATVISEHRMEVMIVNDKPAINTNSNSLHDLISMIDIALAEASGDPDLLVARASAHIILNNAEQASHDLNLALQTDPNHIEAFNLRQYSEQWNNLFFLPPWSSQSKYVHPALAEKANQGDALHSVRHSLQTALVILFIVTEQDWPNAPSRYRWEAICSHTPFGPIGAHYILLDRNGQIYRQECILTPPTGLYDPSIPPPALLVRLSSARTCFIVLANQRGQVLHNLRYDLPFALRSILNKISHLLLKATGANASDNQKATNWHMDHFDMNTLTF